MDDLRDVKSLAMTAIDQKGVSKWASVRFFLCVCVSLSLSLAGRIVGCWYSTVNYFL
jgi:hypothetical protein